MTRGRKPLMALREAGLIARKRGDTRWFMHEPGMICNFVIYCLGFVAHVRIKRVTRLRCSHATIEREAADALATLRSIAPGFGISRELWVYLPRGSFRFFRVEGSGLVELCRDGTVMEVQEKAGPVSGTVPAAEKMGEVSVPADGSPGGLSPPVTGLPPETSDGEIPLEKSRGSS